MQPNTTTVTREMASMASMASIAGPTPVEAPAKAPKDLRLVALRRFAFAITFLNILGHTYLGFEQSWAQPLAALAAAYSMELLLEWLTARSEARSPRFAGGVTNLFHFLLPGHITALACAMLLYANDRIWPLVFAVWVGIAAKTLFRPRVGDPARGRRRHFFNPSNTGITVTLLCFPWVGIAPPYMFTENLFGWADWLLPAIIICSGSFLNLKLTRKIPLIVAWLGGFALQAVVRSLIFGTPIVAALNPMTGVAFLLFTFYMVSDPATTPFDRKGQVLFGLSVAGAYFLLMVGNIVFGLFFALTAVCTVRGAALYVRAFLAERSSRESALPTGRTATAASAVTAGSAGARAAGMIPGGR